MHGGRVMNKIVSYVDLEGIKHGLAFWCVADKAPNKGGISCLYRMLLCTCITARSVNLLWLVLLHGQVSVV